MSDSAEHHLRNRLEKVGRERDQLLVRMAELEGKADASLALLNRAADHLEDKAAQVEDWERIAGNLSLTHLEAEKRVEAWQAAHRALSALDAVKPSPACEIPSATWDQYQRLCLAHIHAVNAAQALEQ